MLIFYKPKIIEAAQQVKFSHWRSNRQTYPFDLLAKQVSITEDDARAVIKALGYYDEQDPGKQEQNSDTVKSMIAKW